MWDHHTYEGAIKDAEKRARRSYFGHYVVTDDERGFLVINEGDYGTIPEHLCERIVHYAEAGLLDEF